MQVSKKHQKVAEMGKTKGKKHNKAASAVSPTGLPSVAQQMKELSTDDLAGIDTVIEKVQPLHETKQEVSRHHIIHCQHLLF